MDEEFYNIVSEIHTERMAQQAQEWKTQQALGEDIYTMFCVWCNGYRNGNGKDSAKVFGAYLKAQGIELDFCQKKHLAEKYFGYTFEYDGEKQKWNIYNTK